MRIPLLAMAVVCSTVSGHSHSVCLAQSSANPRFLALGADIEEVKTIPQNWSDAESNWFYNAAQGSRLLPYRWLLHLEQPDVQEAFLTQAHLKGIGFLARVASPDNPDALPVGLVKDAAYEDGTEAVGVTCAACHTGLVTHQRTAYVIDGGPTMTDIETFLSRLAQSLQQTASDDQKFTRFAAKVIGNSANQDAQNDLRQALQMIARQRSEYNARNFSNGQRARFGHGRIDAFGAIFNEVATTFLGEENSHPADAPVSFPCLWDAPQHDRVQWNGAAENRRTVLGLVLFGTQEVGALGRNTGEVLGVFGHAQINEHELLLPRRYEATANKANLMAIENSLKTLWSPQWPESLAPLDTGKVARGKILYNEHCQACHESISRDDPQRTVTANISNVRTDSKLLDNFTRRVKTGKLQGRRKTLLSRERFGNEDSAAVVLKHVVERVMLNPISIAQLRAALENPLAEVNALNPGFDTTVTIRHGDQSVMAAVDSFESVDGGLRILGSAEALKELSAQLGVTQDQEGVLEIPSAVAAAGYKARPLNGIWATAPYLHNGSVRTLAQLLKPAVERERSFHVGSTELDVAAVGFVDDPSFPAFDTSLAGNGNGGHEHGASLNEQQRVDLIEYLKSL